MAHARFALALIALSLLLLTPRPTSAQSAACDLSGLLPESVRAFLGVPWLDDRLVSVEGQQLNLRFCAPQSQSIVAAQMFDLVEQALPVLERLTDVRLDGSHIRTIYMDTSERVYSRHADGYISNENDQITLHQGSLDSTVVHELAHYWSDRRRFAEPWMVEAYAEYLTSLAMGELGRSYSPRLPVPACNGLPLKRWTSEVRATAICAYSVGPEILHALAREAGQDTLRQVIGELSLRQGGVNSELLLTHLERVSGKNLTPLMRGRVFGPEDDAVLAERSAVRAQFVSLTALAAGLGITLPPTIAEDLDGWRHAAAASKLAQLDPILVSADTTMRRCAELQLACVRPWERLGPDAASWSSLALALADAPQLLSVYGELRAAADSLGVTIPGSLQDSAATLSLDAFPQLQAAGDALAKARTLEAACAPELRCRERWLAAWERGDAAAVAATADELISMLDQAARLETACADLAPTCRQLWRDALQNEGATAATRTIGELNTLISDGATLETACADLAPTCRQLWRDALQNEGATAATRTIGELNTLVAEGARVEAECAAAGWPCARGWRATLLTGDPAAAREMLESQEAALLGLAGIERDIISSDRAGSAGEQRQESGEDVLELVEARAAFERGDVAQAQALSKAAHDRYMAASVLSWLLVIAGAVTVVGAPLLALAWIRRRPRATPARAARPALNPGPGPSNRAEPGSDLLAQLLANPPEDGSGERKP